MLPAFLIPFALGALGAWAAVTIKQLLRTHRPAFQTKRGLHHVESDVDIGSSQSVIAHVWDILSLGFGKLVNPTDVPRYRLYASLAALIKAAQRGYLTQHYSKIDESLRKKSGKTQEEPTKDELERAKLMSSLTRWAYFGTTKEIEQNLNEIGYTMLRHEQRKDICSVEYYVAYSANEKSLVVCIQGTSSTSDALTNLLANSVVVHTTKNCPFTGKAHPVDVYCHQGMIIAAEQMVDYVEELIQDLAIPLGYKATICGHSLGAGTAALLGVILRGRNPDLLRDPNVLDVWSIACPACLSRGQSHYSASFITSVVNNFDVVPRFGIFHVRKFTEMLVEFDKQLDAKGLAPKNMFEAKKFAKLDGEKYVLGEMFNADEAVQRFAVSGDTLEADKDLQKLMVPGRIIFLNQITSKEVRADIIDGEDFLLDFPLVDMEALNDHRLPAYIRNLSAVLQEK